MTGEKKGMQQKFYVPIQHKCQDSKMRGDKQN